MQVGIARGANENRLWYATLRLRPAYAETGGVARLRPLALAFWGLRPLRVLRPPRDAEARLLTIWSVRPNGLRLAAAHSGLPGRRKTAYQVP